MIKGKILFVEDDEQYRNTLKNILISESYQVDAVGTALEGVELFTLYEYDLIISDLIMKTVDGIQFFKYIKKVDEDIKTMILTAKPTSITEIKSLEICVDKYLIKGTHFDVLLKHIEHLFVKPVISRKNMRKKIVYEPENIILDMFTRTVTRNEKKINITTKEFDVLNILMNNMGTAMSREDIIAHLWDEEYEKIDIRVIDVHIRSIRKKLKTQAILSIRGYGYKWDI